MITTSILMEQPPPTGKIDLLLPRRRTPDGAGIIYGAIIGALLFIAAGVVYLVAAHLWRWLA